MFENTLKLNESAVNAPFVIYSHPIGIITEVTEEFFTAEIWDKYFGVEFLSSRRVGCVYLDKNLNL